MPKPTLRAAAQQRFTRQNAAVLAVVRAWQTLRKAEESGDVTAIDVATTSLREALDKLEFETEKT